MQVSERNPYQIGGNLAPIRFQGAPQWWLWPNLLSLDAPAVALLWQVLFVRCFHRQLALLPAFLLSASVWLIYVADRVLDAWRGESSSARHRFYHAHWRAIAPVWMAILAGSAWLAFTQLPAVLLWRGMILLAAIVVYLLVVHGSTGPSRGFPEPAFLTKEATVGLFFAAGVSLAVWTDLRTLSDAAAVGSFLALCWINCAAIQKWESGASAGWPVEGAGLAVAAVAGSLLCFHRPFLGASEMASALALVWLDRSGRRLSPEAVRVLADAALLSPLLSLPFVSAALSRS